MSDRDWSTIQNKRTIPWGSFSNEEFIQFYRRVTAPVLEEEGYDPDRPQPADVYRRFGFARYMQAVRRHYDYTFREFLIEEVGIVEEENPHEYNWPIDDEETKEWLDKFVQDLRKRDSTKQKESTVRRIAHNTYVFLKEWEAAHGSTDIIQTLKDADEDESYVLVLEVYDRLNARDITVNTKVRYVTDHSFWFEFLTHPTNPLEYNPIPDVQARFNWTRKEIEVLERSALSPSHVKQLWKHTETLEEKMLLIAACAWGLRSGEIASLHIDQLILDPEPDDDFTGPVVDFGDRKEGPSTVNIVYGRNVVEKRIQQLKEEFGDEWTGYLFPSTDHRTEHLRGKTILDGRFQPLAQRANVTVDGDEPNLKQARRYWYQRYWTGQQRYHELVTLAAEEQGSVDPVVVETNYLGDLSRLEFSRLWVRRELAEAFEEQDIEKEPIYIDDSVLQSIRDALSDILTFVDRAMKQRGPSENAGLGDEKGIYSVRGTTTTVLLITVLMVAVSLF